MTIRALVVDDEPPARERVRDLLQAEPDVELVGEAGDADQAVERILALRPDLLFLDVQMPGRDGFGVLRALGGERPPATIFTTAHDEFAVRAFEIEALDYLLKPVRRERLAAALARAERRLSSRPPRVVTFERGASRFFDVQAIARFWSSDKYTVFCVDGEEHLTPEPLTGLADRLTAHGFRRIHRGELINLARVRALRSDGVVELDDGSTARASRRSLPSLREELRATREG
jgi:DNA-binding LytR/AlgR family response regulator